MFNSASLCAGLCANMCMCSSVHTAMSNSRVLQYLWGCPGMKGHKEVWGVMEVSERGMEMSVEVRRDEWGVEVSVKMGVRQVRSMAVHVDEPTHTPVYMYHQVYAWV